MVIVDTSVWIRLYRRRSGDLARRLSQLADRNEAATCGHIWVEFIGGVRAASKRRHYAELLAAYPWLDTPREAYDLAATWCATHSKLGAGDAIIAATCKVHGATLLTLDRDFLPLGREGLRVELGEG